MVLHIPVNDFDLDKTLSCGQCFRWNKESDTWHGHINDIACQVKQNDNLLIILSETAISEYNVRHYFSIHADDDYVYNTAFKTAHNMNELKEIAERSKGLRVLRQPYWETVVSYIISQHNSIPNIKNVVNKLCANIGNGKIPTPEMIYNADLRVLKECGCGFRDKYLTSAAEKYLDGTIANLTKRSLQETDELLQQVKGIGPKVAACIELFALGFNEVCPVDVWINRELNRLYPNMTNNEAINHINKMTDNCAGIIQQWIYYCAISEK